MKKSIFALLLIPLLLFCACTPADPGNDPSVPSFKEPARQVFYAGDDGTDLFRLKIEEPFTPLTGAYKLHSDYRGITINLPEGIERVAEVKMGERTFSAEIFEAYRYDAPLFQDPALEGYDRIYRYISANFNIDLYANGVVRSAYSFRETDATAEGDLTEEQAVATAESVVKQVYGDLAEPYAYESVTALGNSNQTGFSVIFRRKVATFRTADAITVYVNRAGQAYYVSAPQMGLFKPLEQDPALWSAMIAAAEEDFATLVGDFETKDRIISFGSDGRYYLSALVKCCEVSTGGENDTLVGTGEFNFCPISMNIN